MNQLFIWIKGKRYFNLSLFVSILKKDFKFYGQKRIGDKVIAFPFKRNIKGIITKILPDNRIVVETKNGSLYNVRLDAVQKYKKDGWHKGIPRSQETCEKMSKSRMGKNNHRYKLSLHWKR